MSLFFQNLLESLRNLRNTKWQTLVSLIGLVVGLVSLTLSVNWLWSEENYDRFRPGYKELYQIQTRHDEGDFKYFSWLHCQDIKEALKGSEAQVGFFKEDGKGKISVTDEPEKFGFGYTVKADSSLIEVLQIEPLAGSLDALFGEGENIVLTRSMAERLFTSPERAIGQSVNLKYWFGRYYYNVVGVVEDCEEASNIYYDFLQKLPQAEDRELQYTKRGHHLLVRTPDVEHTQMLLPTLRAFGAEGDTLNLVQKPLRNLHVSPGKDFSVLDVHFYRIAFVCISALLLLSALVNLLISFTCIFLGRMREYALRRSLGASAWKNDLWMLTELLPSVLFAVMLGGVALEWLRYKDFVPGFADHVFTVYAWVLTGAGIALLLMLLYPIAKMRRAYHSSFSGSASSSVSHSYLLVVQCFCCALLLFLSIGMQRQISGMLNADLGFERENILRLYTGIANVYDEDEKQEYDFEFVIPHLAGEFRKEAGAGITDAIFMPADIFNKVSNYEGIVVPEEIFRREEQETGSDWDKMHEYYTRERADLEKYQNITLMEIPYDALKFFNLKTENGKEFTTAGLSAEEWPVMLNRKALELLGLNFPSEDKLFLRMLTMQQNAINNSQIGGEHYFNSRLRVQDVMDFCLTDFHQQEDPIVFIGIPENHRCTKIQYDAVYIKYAPGRRDDAEAAVRRVLVERFDADPEKIHLDDMESHIAFTYEEEIYYANLLTAVTAFSVFITFSGVLSLLLYTLRLRRRQMAIHRLMGAELRDVLRATLWPYIVYTLLGGVLAYVPGIYFMRKWMEWFHYGEAPGLGFMVLIIAGMLLVVFLLVLWQVRRAMHEKPVEVLRPEA